ncbi:MAG: hypothetical protein WKF80_10265 [Thermomicrobiales bacterium]
MIRFRAVRFFGGHVAHVPPEPVATAADLATLAQQVATLAEVLAATLDTDVRPRLRTVAAVARTLSDEDETPRCPVDRT